ncbi:class II glutamine amidotransferase [Spectribacter hydrogenooxidans]|uniref:Class II glutamine amidotransferase n=1 Tax=Spectribacter hydrogenoxidans TaxID=3075608 RepID=A0ABU3BXJ3_9GAMM|nr:class II glutamine amidotransferase [Salinisphaera sp. W335]MDT0634035.1 class II glutamine amidotransferase [Salinisphaera sp. W335]
MCRIAAYLGPPLVLAEFLQRPPHSLYRQSWAPREMLTATVNADGWGVAWRCDDGRPGVYRHPLPIWADINLDSLGRSLVSREWVGNVRSATTGLGTSDVNTQPFTADGWLFTHNGYVADFAAGLRRELRAGLSPAIEADIQGNTDSEYLLAWLREQQTDPANALRRTVTWLRDHLIGDDDRALLNLLISDGQMLHATRAAIGADCPSLYWHPGHSGFGGGCLIASETLDDDVGWQPVPPQHQISLAPGRAPVFEPC